MYTEDQKPGTIILQRTNDFSQVYESIRKRDFKKDILIEKFRFIYPHHILMLVQYFILQKKAGIEGILFGSSKTNGYLRAIHLDDFCNTNYNNHQHTPSTSTAIPITRIDTASLEEYKLNFVNFLTLFCNGKDLTMIKLCIDELVNNVYDHSQSEIGAYIFCQFYEKTNTFKFAISDIGIGIPDNINNFYPKLNLSSIEALMYAIGKGNTTKSKPFNRGYGLDNLFSILKGINAKAEIFSSNAYCKLKPNGLLSYTSNPIQHFKGTIVYITINVSNLDDKEEDIIDEFNY